jgi:hypothetical protein
MTDKEDITVLNRSPLSRISRGVLTLTGLSTLSGRCDTLTCQAAAAADRVETSKSVENEVNLNLNN